MDQPINPGDIRAGIWSEPFIGEFGNLDLSRINHNQLGTFELDRPFDIGGENRVVLGCVGSRDQNNVGIFNIADWVCRGATSKTRGQTGHCGRVSETGAVIDIVGLYYRPGEFLKQVVLLIGDPGGYQHSNTIRAIFISYLSQSLANQVKGFFPGRFSKGAVFFDQRMGQAFF